MLGVIIVIMFLLMLAIIILGGIANLLEAILKILKELSGD